MQIRLSTTQPGRNTGSTKKITLRSAFELYQRSNLKFNLLQFPYITPDYIPESKRIIKIFQNRTDRK